MDTLDAILEDHAAALGADFTPYRHHAYRVIHLCDALLEGMTDEQREKLQIAIAFHDLGIWTDHTFDYLGPSMVRAGAYLTAHGRGAWQAEFDEMILEHHKLRSAPAGGLVEALRRADWVDVTYGVRGFGLPRALVRDLFARFPDAGFHRRLVQLTWQRAKQHPTSPLPVLRF